MQSANNLEPVDVRWIPSWLNNSNGVLRISPSKMKLLVMFMKLTRGFSLLMHSFKRVFILLKVTLDTSSVKGEGTMLDITKCALLKLEKSFINSSKNSMVSKQDFAFFLVVLMSLSPKITTWIWGRGKTSIALLEITRPMPELILSPDSAIKMGGFSNKLCLKFILIQNGRNRWSFKCELDQI